MRGKDLMLRESNQLEPVAQADNDNQVVTMWLHGGQATTQPAKTYKLRGLLAAVGNPSIILSWGSSGLFLYHVTTGASVPGLGH